MNSFIHSKDKNHVDYVHQHLCGPSERGEKACRYNGLFRNRTCRIVRSVKSNKIVVN